MDLYLYPLTHKSLPFVISQNPKLIEKADISPGTPSSIERADDSFLIMDLLDRKMYDEFALYFLSFPILILITSFGTEEFLEFIMLSFTPSLIFFTYGRTIPDKKLILDRQNGLITIPGFMWLKSSTLKFTNIRMQIGRRNLNVRKRYSIIGYYVTNYDELLYWNLFVWYMDKNRPLPPGSAFDPYRDRDYQRRKARGFPKPLFRSAFPIGEHFTPEPVRLRPRKKRR